jgi:hypothetical protein
MYLTVKEAIDLSGKSQTTIHRLCQKFDDSKFIKKEGNKYLIDKDFLMQKYPTENDMDDTENNYESKDLINSDKEQNLIKSLTEKNLRITELTVENEELSKQVDELEQDLFDLQQELAESMDANMGLQKEKQALTDIEQMAGDIIKPEQNTDEKELILYRTITITGALMVLIAFIAFMYYFTK